MDKAPGITETTEVTATLVFDNDEPDADVSFTLDNERFAQPDVQEDRQVGWLVDVRRAEAIVSNQLLKRCKSIAHERGYAIVEQSTAGALADSPQNIREASEEELEDVTTEAEATAYIADTNVSCYLRLAPERS